MSCELFERERAASRPLVAAFVVATEGSTYRKAGAFMCIAGDGAIDGLLSGGCLEADLTERARRLLAGGAALDVAVYDSRTSDDPIWGLGLGCEGLMRIALLRVGPESGWQPLGDLCNGERAAEQVAIAIVVDAAASGLPGGAVATATANGASAHGLAGARIAQDAMRLEGAARARLGKRGAVLEGGVFSMASVLPPAVLVCGAGPDVVPVVDWGAQLGWHVTIVDHRPAYLENAASRFPRARRVLGTEAARLAEAVVLERYCAAVVMSHHLVADGQYLAALAASPIPYVGLLGPPARRERLFAELGPAAAARLAPRLRAPIGLDLGGGTPESIALSIVAEIQAALCGRDARPFSTPHGAAPLT